MDESRHVKRGRSHPDGRRDRWRGHREARRGEMVDAAIRAVRRRGPGVGMDDIAAEAGVSKPILYRLFTDKADLYVAVGRRAAETLVAAITAELEREQPPRAHVSAVIDAYLRFIEEEPDLYRFVVGHALVDRPVDRDPVDDYTAMVAAHLSRVIGERLRAARLDAGGAEPWGRALVGLVRAAGEWWLDRRTMTRGALTDYLTTLIWGGFAGLYDAAAGPVEHTAPAVPLRLVSPDETTSPGKRRAPREGRVRP